MGISTGSIIYASDLNGNVSVSCSESYSGTMGRHRCGHILIVSFNGCYFSSVKNYGSYVCTLSGVTALQSCYAACHDGTGAARHVGIGSGSNIITMGNTGLPAYTALYGSIVIPVRFT